MFVSSVEGSPGAIYQPGCGVTNDCRLDTLEACQDMVDHTVSSGEEEIKRLGEEVVSLKVVETEVRGLRNQTKNLETLLESEIDMKKATEAKNTELAKELESLRAKRAFANVVSAGIAKGMSEGLEYGVKHGEAKLDLAAIEAYDPEADNKYIATLHALKDLKYPLIDQLEKVKDAPLDLIMTSLHLESDTGEDATQWIRELRPNSSQLTIHVYPEVRDPKDPWACKEEILLGDAIAANISHAEKKKMYRVVCRTHSIGSAHHARSDGVPVSIPTVAPQGFAILLADAATQIDISEDEASPRLLRSKSLPPMYNLDWP
ncbi:hypothetical protein Tco_1411294 [Tanacetum coccineum]